MTAWEHDELVHGYWVDPGRILAGEYPGDLGSETAARKLGVLLDAGIRTFVNLTCAPDPLEPYADQLTALATARGITVRHLPHPIPDMSVLAEDGGYDAIVQAINAAAEHGGVFVHCWGGRGRTGTVVGCWLVDQGLDGEQALARIAELRATTLKARFESPETDAQREVVRRRGLTRL